MLVDGHGLVYRGWYALQELRPLTNAKGELTTGVYAFTSMLLKALGDLKPDYLAAAFDMGAPSIRLGEFADYKATRPATPQGLPSQVEMSRRVLEAMDVPMYHVQGHEADDVIGTLAKQAERQDLDVVILTGDNDLLQVVGPHVEVVTSRRGISDTILYDEDKVTAKYGGLRPDQIPDFKALCGDATDNIPGVPGIGDKTAAKLLLDHGSVERLLEHLDDLPRKQRELLEPRREQVLLAKRLATIVCDLPIELDLEAARIGDLRRTEVIAIFQELSFKSLIDRLPQAVTPPPGRAQLDLFSADGEADGAAGGERFGSLVQSPADLDELIRRMRAHGSLAFNVQATGTLPMQADVVGIGLAAGEAAAYIPLGHVEGQQLDRALVFERLRPLFADAALAKAAHNAKFHMLLLARNGVPVRGVAFDTMIAAFLLESGQRTLALRDLAWSKLQVEIPSVASLLGTGKKAVTMAQLPMAGAGAFASREADLVQRLVPILEAELAEAEQTRLFREVEMPLVPVLADMEQAGVAVDLAYLAELGRELNGRLAELEAEIYRDAGHEFNINSTQQLSEVLFAELHLETRSRKARTKTGHVSTGQDVLEELRGTHPIIERILEHRQLQKLKSTYVDALQALVNPETGRVHTTFNQTGAATGRLSSSDPNLQNIPIRSDEGRRVRRAFVARPGELLLSADYSHIELRVLAHMTGDPTLFEAFAAGEDPHAATAAEVLDLPIERVTPNDRRVAKMVNYGVLYGMSDYGLADRLGLPADRAADFIARYFERFNTVRQFQENMIREVQRLGYAKTILGRRRYFPELRNPIYTVRQAAIRQAVNAPVQGSASDIVKKAMIEVAAYLEREAPTVRMLLQVHDELLFEGPESELRRVAPGLGELMIHAVELKVPLHVDFKLGPNWQDMRTLLVADEARGPARPGSHATKRLRVGRMGPR
jgi:DNA polymerase I